jgi:O-methyltransferase
MYNALKKINKILRSNRLTKYSYEFDGMATIHNSDFMREENFLQSYQIAEATGSWCGHQMPWRAYIYFWFASLAMGIEGDFVECGVNRGGLARGAVNYIRFENSHKNFYLLDTFDGFEHKYLSDQEQQIPIMYSGHYTSCYEQVKENFRSFSNVKIIKGSVPDTLSLVSCQRVAFLSIDMNCAFPEVKALEYFWETLSEGAVVILDDYGFKAHAEQKRCHDRFADQHGTKVLALPTGQGILLKH